MCSFTTSISRKQRRPKLSNKEFSGSKTAHVPFKTFLQYVWLHKSLYVISNKHIITFESLQFTLESKMSQELMQFLFCGWLKTKIYSTAFSKNKRLHFQKQNLVIVCDWNVMSCNSFTLWFWQIADKISISNINIYMQRSVDILWKKHSERSARDVTKLGVGQAKYIQNHQPSINAGGLVTVKRHFKAAISVDILRFAA